MSSLGKVAEYVAAGFFAVVALSIIFVSAGRKGGANGGQQTATIINSLGSAASSTASSLEQG